MDRWNWIRKMRRLLAVQPDESRVCVLEDRLVLVPDDIAKETPHHLTINERLSLVDLGEIGLSEVA